MGMMEAITAEPMLYGGILAASLLLIGVVGVVMKKKKKAPAAPAKAGPAAAAKARRASKSPAKPATPAAARTSPAPTKLSKRAQAELEKLKFTSPGPAAKSASKSSSRKR